MYVLIDGWSALLHAYPILPSIDRTQKLKDARSEAAKEIEEMKSKLEADFKSFQKEVGTMGLVMGVRRY